MTTISSFKAHPATRGDLALRVNFDRLPKDFADEKWSDAASREEYQREARALVEALVEHLPGGLLDAVFSVLAERQASLLIVPHRWGTQPKPMEPSR